MTPARPRPSPRAIALLLSALLLIMSWPLLAGELGGTGRRSRQAGKVEHGLVILVEFPDVKHDVRADSVQERFSRRLNGYVREMSYDRVSLTVDVTRRWHRMPGPVGDYRISPRNLEVDKSRVRKLIDDALAAAENDVDLSAHSFVVIYMGAMLSDYGMIGLCGYPGMLGWTSDDVLRTRRGQVVKGGVAIFTHQAHLGTLFHDIAHILGGVRAGKRNVPCLYDHDLQARPGPLRETFLDAIINMGFWDPMSCHYYKRDLPPPGISSWTKLRLGWMDQSQVRTVKRGETAEVTLGALQDASAGTVVIRIPLSATTYYLVENRQPIGFDKNLPGHGVLIMYADDTVPECRHGRSPVRLMNADPTVPHLEGAAFDVGKKAVFEDEKNGIRIELAGKTGSAYRVRVRPL